VLERFRDEFPNRYINVGVAEQNMIGIASGLALSGKIVFVYSIANFPTLRCLEQIRNDVCYHNLRVHVVAVGGGLSYGSLGYSHHGIEDIAIMRSLPNIIVASPGDPNEARVITELLSQVEGPSYLRIGKSGESNIHRILDTFSVGKSIELCKGTEAALISTGSCLDLSYEVANRSNSLGISTGLYSFPFLKPFDVDRLLEIALSTKHIITIEEHKEGGLGTIVAEILATNNISCKLSICRIPDTHLLKIGNHDYLREQSGLTVEHISNIVYEYQLSHSTL
jgi:transketolase